MKLKYPIECVTWEDHYSQDDWIELEKFDNKAATVVSVGYLVKEDDIALTLALNVCDGTEVSCAMTIIKKCVLARKRIKDVSAARVKPANVGEKSEGVSVSKIGDGPRA